MRMNFIKIKNIINISNVTNIIDQVKDALLSDTKRWHIIFIFVRIYFYVNPHVNKT